MVALSLIPYLALSSAMLTMQQVIERKLQLSQQAFELTAGMANAAYAFGTVLAVQLAMRLRGRRLLVRYSALLVVASVVAAAAPSPALFIAAHIVQGFCTSLMLIAAVPPLVIGWPVKKMPVTAMIMNLCVFGAVALGPVVGGIQAGGGDWHILFWCVAGCAVASFLLVLLTFEDVPPADEGAPWDLISLLLAGGGCAAAFFGASELTTHPMLSTIVFLPLIGGLATLVVLVVHQAGVKDPLIPVRELFTTKPVAGILSAMAAGAASIAAIELVELAIKPSGSPSHLAMLFWPEFGGAVFMAVVFGALLRTRGLTALAFGGLIVLAGGIATVTGIVGGGHRLVIAAAALIGIGVGATVAPSLFVAGYSVRSALIQRVFALVELLRAVAAFMTAPVIVHLAMTVNGGVTGGGIKTGMWVCFAIVATGAGLALMVFLLGGAKLQQPDLERWQRGEEPAWDSPPLLAVPRRANAAATETYETARRSPSGGGRPEGRYGEGPDDGYGAGSADGRPEAARR
jgi:MFS family permease